MKFKYLILLIPIFFLIILYFSCADTGVNPFAIPEGTTTLRVYNLKPLDPNIDGLYEAWLLIDSSGSTIYSSMGVFNVDNSSNPIDPTSGQQKSLKFTGDTNMLNNATHCTISIATPGNQGNFSNQPCFLDVLLTHWDDSLTGNLTIGGSLALDTIGRVLIEQPDKHFGLYMLYSRTSNNPNADCKKGIWFCDVSGFSSLGWLGALPQNSLWIYEGWVKDSTSDGGPYYYSTGRFSDPAHMDLDSAGSCSGPNKSAAFDKPGQEWIQQNCPSGKPAIDSLYGDGYKVFITLEPKSKTVPDHPFFFKIFFNTRIPPLGCGQQDIINNPFVYGQLPFYKNGPYATVNIRYNNHYFH